MGNLIILEVTKKQNFNITEIWSPNSMQYLDFVTLTIPTTKFQIISRYITFDRIETYTGKDSKFQNMQHIFSHFQKDMLKAKKPYTHTCVDETLYAFRGNFSFRQYIHIKPAKYSIKFSACVMWTHLTYIMSRFMVERNLNKVNKIRALKRMFHWTYWKILRAQDVVSL